MFSLKKNIFYCWIELFNRHIVCIYHAYLTWIIGSTMWSLIVNFECFNWFSKVFKNSIRHTKIDFIVIIEKNTSKIWKISLIYPDLFHMLKIQKSKRDNIGEEIICSDLKFRLLGYFNNDSRTETSLDIKVKWLK